MVGVVVTMSIDEKWILNQHPCFNPDVERWFEYYPLTVASGCNIRCHYCSRVYDCMNDNIPGRVSKILSPREALKKVHNAQRQNERIRVVCFNGPGEPLASKETLDFIKRTGKTPHFYWCGFILIKIWPYPVRMERGTP